MIGRGVPAEASGTGANAGLLLALDVGEQDRLHVVVLEDDLVAFRRDLHQARHKITEALVYGKGIEMSGCQKAAQGHCPKCRQSRE